MCRAKSSVNRRNGGTLWQALLMSQLIPLTSLVSFIWNLTIMKASAQLCPGPAAHTPDLQHQFAADLTACIHGEIWMRRRIGQGAVLTAH